MDLTPYAESLRAHLQSAAAAGDPAMAAAADRLAIALDPAARLALMEALSHASDEITAKLPSGSVEVRLDGRDLDFVVDLPSTSAQDLALPEAASEESAAEDGEPSRITLRIPENVKAKAEEQAAAAGQSLNTYLVGVIRAATRLSEQAVRVEVDLSSLRLGHGPRRHQGGPRRMTGWL